MEAENLKEWNNLKQWVEYESTVQSVKILLNLDYADNDIEKDLNLTNKELRKIKEAIAQLIN